MFMSFNTLFQPALFIMNRLPFKIKIIVSIAILFLLFLFPAQTLFSGYVDKNSRYNKQLVGLQYIEMINSFIRTVQLHRTLSLEFLEKKNTLEESQELLEDLDDKESKFYNQKVEIMNNDQLELKVLSSNQNFMKAIALFEVIQHSKFDDTTSAQRVFKSHNDVVNRLTKTVREIAEISRFSSSKDLRINYLADMLQEKLLRLYDFTRQLKDTSFSRINNQKRLKEQKLIIYSLATDLRRLQLNLKENELLSHLSNYEALEEKITEVTSNIEKLLLVIDDTLINNQISKLSKSSFLDKVEQAIESEEELYGMFVFTYRDTVYELKSTSQQKIWSLFLFFLTIIAIAFYIFIAFYQSITGNLKKLQTASELIAMGQTKIKLDVDRPDEIGDALLAFNTMSEKLTENIAFLDGYKRAIDKSSIVSKTDTRGIITYVNKMFCDVSGYTEDELLGRSHNIVRHPSMSKEVFEDMWETIKAKKIWKGIVKNRSKDGSVYIVNATILPILDSDNNILEYVAVRHNITELERSKEEIKQQRTDLLTGLPNRNQLLYDLKKSLKPVLFYLNIDDFSGFNDFYGASIGDSLLIHLGESLNELKMFKLYKLYKLQADQFILLFEEDCLDNKNFKTFFQELIVEIEERISNINFENQNRISLSVSGGVATYFAHDNYQNLILYANIARKKAKILRKKFMIFEHSMRNSEDYAQNIEWIKRIKEAIEDDRVVNYYQPILDNKSKKILKYETLVRMLDRDGVPLPTWKFLEIAQKAKLYPQVTQIVIDKAFKMFEEYPEYEFSLNLTIDDILSKTTTEFIYSKLENYAYTDRVIFEITESEEVNDYKVINEFIKDVKQYGVKIAIDDFGSGYANFEHIINIDADYIKIDGTLIKNINHDKNAKIITEAIIDFSRKLGKKTITEFVHSEEVYHIVRDLGADYSQGYFFGAPSATLIESE